MKEVVGILTVILLVSCVQHQDTNSQIDGYFDPVEVEIKYAYGFEVQKTDDYTRLISHSFGTNESFADTVYLPHRDYKFKRRDKVISADMSSLACQSSTHLAFIDQLDLLDKVKGLCGLQYVSGQEKNATLEKNEVIEICSGEKTDIETLLNVNPDLYFTYPFGMSAQDDFDENGVKTFLVAEYLEENQLARLEWIKVFGLLLNKAEEANAYFAQVEKEYLELKESAAEKKSANFIMNLPYGENWYMPSSQSVGVQLIEDAGLTYYYRGESGTENMTRSKEEVWSDGTKADYWIIIASRPDDFSMADLMEEEPVYKEFKAVKNRTVFFCNTGTTDYFAEGVVEPHILLRELQQLVRGDDPAKYKYFSRLN